MNNLPIETYESVVQQRDALAVENGRLCNRITHAEGCFSAAIFEGLNEAIIESYGSNLADIVSRRIVYAFPSIGEPNPATDAFKREMMAKGVDSLAAKYANTIKTMHPDTIACGALRQTFYWVIKEANKFAAQLRKGINDAQ